MPFDKHTEGCSQRTEERNKEEYTGLGVEAPQARSNVSVLNKCCYYKVKRSRYPTVTSTIEIPNVYQVTLGTAGQPFPSSQTHISSLILKYVLQIFCLKFNSSKVSGHMFVNSTNSMQTLVRTCKIYTRPVRFKWLSDSNKKLDYILFASDADLRSAASSRVTLLDTTVKRALKGFNELLTLYYEVIACIRDSSSQT